MKFAFKKINDHIGYWCTTTFCDGQWYSMAYGDANPAYMESKRWGHTIRKVKKI